MPQFGTVKRQNPRIEVLRGYNPMEPHQLSSAYPVKTGVTILSGQVCSLERNANIPEGFQWELGWEAGRIPHLALNDSTDEDVIEAGKLPALSCLGKFEVEIPFYKEEDEENFTIDVPVGPDGTTGDVKIASAESGEPIMGYVTRNHGPKSLIGKNSNVVVTDVISFNTVYLPNLADAGA